MTRKMILLAALMTAAPLLPAQEPARIPQSPESTMRVAEKIRKKIVMLSNYGVFDFISFGLAPARNGYRVTLQGFASRPTLRESAERVLKGMEELDGVDNKIEVLPLSPADERIRMAVYARIYYHASLSRYNPNRGAPVFGGVWNARRSSQMGISTNPPPGVHPISIIVKNGDVALMGMVDNEGDRQLAGMLANQVSGAFKVTNLLDTVHKPKQSGRK